MPLLSARWLSTVSVKYGRQPVGRAVRVWFDLDTGQSLGLIVKVGAKSRLLPRQSARLTDKGLAISNKNDLLVLEKPARAEQVSRLSRHLLGAAVETEDGRRVGVLRDILITDIDWRLAQLIVHEKSGDRLLSREVIVTLADDVVTVRNGVLDVQLAPWLSAASFEMIH
jgi:sporulation protein YlmC with PRC-barrel domain